MGTIRDWLRMAAAAAWLGMAGFAPQAEAVDNIATNSGYWTNAAIWSAGLPASDHDVIIPTGITVTNTGLATTFITSLTLTGTLTHAANASTETHKLILDIAGNLTIASDGKIDVSSKGYLNGGPGKATSREGNGHGGEGGWSTYGGTRPPAYGSITNPVSCGSGYAAAGGGVVLLRVAGAIAHDGTIAADGVNGWNTENAGGGAGGSINIVAGVLNGSGTLTAAGGLGSGGWAEAGGGGGRIAVVLTNGVFGAFPVTNITAIGGVLGSVDYSGAAGTVYLKDTNQTYGTLVVRNFTNAYQTASRTPMSNGTYRFDSIVVTNRGVLAVGTNATLDLTGCTLSGDNNTGAVGANIGGRIVFGLPGSTVIWPNPFTNGATLSQAGTNQQTITGDVTVMAGGMFTHELNSSNAANKLNLKVDGSLTVNSGGAVNVSGCGHGPGCGPGTSPSAGGFPRGGAGHGGQGGRGYGWTSPGGTTYGAVTNPVNLGSGSGLTRGGGAAIVWVTGAITHNGTITAVGEAAPGGNNTGAGAGGSIHISAATLSGSGLMSARGGAGADAWDCGGGGGGRITVILSGGDFIAFPVTNITAVGGANTAGSGEEPGAAGTVCLKTSGQTYGSLTIANSNLTTASKTLVSTNVTDAVVGDVTLLDNGQLSLYTNLTLTVYGNWSNGTANAVSGGGTVLLAGATTNTVYGNTTFDTFTCQTPGKALKFEAGKTNTMLTGLTIAGASNNPVSLLPAIAGQQWFIKITNSIPAPPISYVVVSNSTAVTNGNGWALAAQFSTWEYVGVSNALNNNTNWSFPESAKHKQWTGSQNASWGNENNWSPSGVPQSTDLSITIPAAPTNQPTLDIVPPPYPCPLAVQSGARLMLGGNNLTVGALTNVGAIVATAGETLTCLNAVDFTGGSFTSAQSTVRLAGSGPQGLTANGSTFYALQIANTNAVTVTDGFSARDLTFPSNSANVAFNSGFTATNVSVVVTNGATLAFTAGQTYNVLNGLVLSGAAGKPILMNNAGGSWMLNVGGYAAVRYVDVAYSDARGGRKIYAVNSTDGNNNQNWDFGAGKLWTGTTTSWTNDANWLPLGAPVSTNVVLIDGATNTMPRVTNATTIAGLIVAGASGPATLTVDMPSEGAALTVTGDLGIGANATLTHTANPAGTADVYRLVLDVSGNLTIASGGAINVSTRGYAAGYGPGTPSSHVGLIYRGGAGYGGEGGIGYLNTTLGGTTYGSVVNPTQLGSGSKGKAGGGAVIVRVAGAAVHNGIIAADGEAAVSGVDAGGAGSGGSINLTAATLAGSGTMTARGGAGMDSWDNGGGGGGRIAVILSGGDFAAFPAANITALGGAIASYTGEEPGAAGTVYLQTAAQGAGRGTVTIANSNQTTAAGTHIPPATNAVGSELRYVAVVVTNRGAVAITTNSQIRSLAVVSTNEILSLGTTGVTMELKTLSVNGTAYAKDGYYTTNNWNGLPSPGANVTGAGAILMSNVRGTVFAVW